MSLVCSSCSKTGHLECAVCACTICKACAHFVGEEAVEMLSPKPEYYALGVFCSPCFTNKVEPEIAAYAETVARAGEVNVFYKTESKESRFIRRVEKPIKVKDCSDRDDVLMKLAFVAASRGFNILLDVEAGSEKVHMAGWQTSNWHGVAVPATVDPAKLNRRILGTPN